MRNEHLMNIFIRVSWINFITYYTKMKMIHELFVNLKDAKHRREVMTKNSSRATGAFRFFNITKRTIKTEPKNRIVVK